MSVTLLLALAIIGFVFGFGIRYSFDPMRKRLGVVVSAVIQHYLDEKHFRVNELLNKEPDLGMTKEELISALEELVDRGVLQAKKGGYYVLLDPLVFLTERDYERAIRITKDDNILYGGYQHPFLSNMEFFMIYGIFVFAVVISALTVFDIGPVRGWLESRLPPVIDWKIFLLFLLVMMLQIRPRSFSILINCAPTHLSSRRTKRK